MCLAIPARVLTVNTTPPTALVDCGGVTTTVSLALLNDVAVGEYVLLHVGYALGKIDAAEAEQTLALMREAGIITAPPAAL